MTTKLSVTPKRLIFPKYGITTLAIRVTANKFQSHINLPSCFTVVTSKIIEGGTNLITVTFNGLSQPMISKFEDIVIEEVDAKNPVSARVQVFVEDESNQHMRDNALECKICTLQFTEDGPQTPKMLAGCGHTVCESCIQQLEEKYGDDPFTCPFDRTVSDYVHKNYTIIEMLSEIAEKEAQTMIAQSELIANPIVPCYENEHHEASHYCQTCDKKFCQSCYSISHATKIFKTHKAILLHEMPISISKCPRCARLDVESFCQNHECSQYLAACCRRCFEENHIGCKMGSTSHVAYKTTLALKKLLSEFLELQEMYSEKSKKNLEECTRRLRSEYRKHYDTLKKFEAKRDLQKVLRRYQKRIDNELALYEKNASVISNLAKSLSNCLMGKIEIRSAEKLIKEANIILEGDVREYGRFDTMKRFVFPKDPIEVIDLAASSSEDDEPEIPPRKKAWLSTNPRDPRIVFRSSLYDY